MPMVDISSSDRSDTSETKTVEAECPTCGARQAPADECRRCQCDLRMVRDVERQYDELRLRCLALMRTRRLKRATEAAHDCRAVSSEECSQRLLAACYLLQGDFPSALKVYATPNRPEG
jgi:hypothetical protein